MRIDSDRVAVILLFLIFILNLDAFIEHINGIFIWREELLLREWALSHQ